MHSVESLGAWLIIGVKDRLFPMALPRFFLLLLEYLVVGSVSLLFFTTSMCICVLVKGVLFV